MKYFKNWKQNIFLMKKIGVTVLIIFLIVFGQHITLPFVKSSDFFSESQSLFSISSSLTGGNLTKASIFSLGLSPYMTAMLVWRLAHLNSKDDKSSIHLVEKRMKIWTIVVALLQSFAVAINLTYTVNYSDSLRQVIFVVVPVCIVLVAGAFITMWFGNLNTKYGLGGITLIIFLNMVHQLINQFVVFYQGYGHYIWLLVLFSGAVIMFATITEKTEYRIGLSHPSIYSTAVDESYLPIKLNPAGGLPIMYAMVILMIPQYIILGLNIFTSTDLTQSEWLVHLTTSRLSGISIYLILVFLLTILFSLFNIDPRRLAEQMRRESDYISDVRPGKPTQNYIAKMSLFFGMFSGFLLVIVVGIPLVVAFYYPTFQTYAMLPGLFIMMTNIIFTIIEEIRGIRIGRYYKSIFE